MVFGLDTEIGLGGGGGGSRIEDTFTPTLGQTIFTLSGVPVVPDDTSMFVNTVKYLYSVHFTVAGNQLTWLDVGFTLDTVDSVEIIWFL